MKTLVEEHIKESNKDSHFVLRMIAMALSIAVFAYAAACVVLNVDTRYLGYHENGGVDYQVCLKPNNYFADECQPAGKQYVAALINRVKTHFKYNFRADDQLNYNYSYEITAQLTATESGTNAGKVLYENKEVLVPAKTVSGQTGQNFSIAEDIELDYGKYNNLITSFRADYGLTLNAYVVVSLNVKVQGKHGEFSQPLNASQAVAVKVPLSERTINVALESDSLSNTGTLEEISRDLGKNLAYIAVAGVSGVVFVILLVISIRVFVRREARRSAYDKELGHILHSYNQLIVGITHIPKIPRDKIVEVKTFDELLDARDTIQQPILHLELSDDRSLFIIEDQGMAYVYALAGRGRREKT